ncbi:2-amino-4-hydroxy-6-hydroxymethyldihydropteridine diphosphokinase [Catalinimonas alkaloidigena]|uniref:2-amino-4-hydroxy-6- hydroxymethyldihydropteridine diphosphokinase n=1 Tax=Catalinimonas alkaloidigena TaxID=1075417 RepID=UPI002405717A|nr:2-amino-4-hydroxy-6-hydroxymethyldihydropteridine diphosphokinase [Catalinimonas alkaloidigena]MDF9796791.1 2-amino-4-hydroxy-6-hydroxymethyldihydropteridine diphosphokinase [Catalinimonas alkaloidigena]
MKSSIGIYLLLGSNLGDRLQVLADTQKEIEKTVGAITKASNVYETEPWGVSNQPSFYNQVVKIDSELSPHKLLNSIQLIEYKIGKIKLGKWRERLIDIDILYYDQLLIDDEELTLPHPEIQNRRFTLVPMCELNPDFIHPVFNKSQVELLANCPDELKVWSLDTTLI